MESFRAQYLGIGINSRVRLLGDNNQLYAKGGLNGKININSSPKTELVECGEYTSIVNHNSTIALNKFYLDIKLGIGYEWSIGTDRKVFIESDFRFALTNPLLFPDNVLEINNIPDFMGLGLTIGLML